MKNDNYLLFYIFLTVRFLFLSIPVYSFQQTITDTTLTENANTTTTGPLLAKVGGKKIYLDEFYRRAEYTIRPAYCKGNTTSDKMIILNSLIAEKLIALEYENDEKFAADPVINNYLRGRREQAMRQVLFLNEGWEKAEIEKEDLQKAFRAAGRTYRVKFFTAKKHAEVDTIENSLRERYTFEQIFTYFTGSEIPETREIDFHSNELPLIQQTLFRDTLSRNQMVGPLAIDDTTFLYMKIDGWEDEVTLSPQHINDRYETVKQVMREWKADEIYDQFIAGVMREKKLEFNTRIFLQLAKVLAPAYLRSEQEKKEMFLKGAFGKENEIPGLDNFAGDIEKLRPLDLFKIDNEIWTVQDFENYISIHPLVFRKKKIANNEFALQLRLAVVDMLQDKYLAEEAYKKGLDKDNRVIQYQNMFRDANAGLYGKYKFLESFDKKNKNVFAVINDFLNPYIDTLQKKYSEVIEINVEEFNKIKLTGIDMFAVQENVPYPIIVPGFPQLTTDRHLDYGSKMNKQNKD
ncbi:MAG: hypothetical protein K9J16_12950 [Melioribacteraceae bacterium]|nr:hypothetical protein [Melioribacteraceae bacterium]MCF8353657.1 hypothetical protein [Melioribacteraceae bacterium]MCF8393427.1 hypothetical protein [Melioribacteraceae bacterium]MCF8419284.1 hypothetical protein [Melioribacteraceae bacterium]